MATHGPDDSLFSHCDECKRPISRKALICPGCGAPNRAKGWRMIAIGLMLMALALAINRCGG